MMVEAASRFLRLLMVLTAAAVIMATTLGADAWAGTRRAFVVGVQQYEDNGLQTLLRPVNDAKDIAKDLEDAGFPHENIKLATNFRTKADFLKSLNDFLNAVKPGDEVLFFFSGHGFGASGSDVNYLLFGGTRSLRTFTRDRLQKSSEPQEKDQSKDPAAVRLREKDFESNYEIEEIKVAGISEQEVQDQIMTKQPAVLLMILDACRTLIVNENRLPGEASMTGLHTHKSTEKQQWLKPGVAILYSASDGEAAIERMDILDERHNSLFTDLLRINIQRPGVELRALADQLSKQVDGVAWRRLRLHQQPQLVDNIAGDFRFIPSVGAERFPLPEEANPCFGADADLAEATSDGAAAEDHLITHIDRFAQCPSVDKAKAELSRLRQVSGRFRHPQGDCDDLAASPDDPSLKGKRGVPIELIGRLDPPFGQVRQAGEPDEFDTNNVVEVCTAAVRENPRISRYALNLARAENAHALNPRNSPQVRREYLERARIDYERLAAAGEPLAMNNLSKFYVDTDPKSALEWLSKAAQQDLPVAQVSLAHRYWSGWPEAGLARDTTEFRHWMGLAAHAGRVDAIFSEAESERFGWGNDNENRNPALAVELLKRAARFGSKEAERELGDIYWNGAPSGSRNLPTADEQKKTKASDPAVQPAASLNDIAEDDQQALIWWGRAAAHGDAASNYSVSYLLENARGVSEPQPQIAARYLRAAAEAGYPRAQVEYVDQILGGTMLLRFDDHEQVIDRLLKRAMTSGDGRAALLLAERAWPNNPNLPRKPRLAAAYAFAAIDLAAHADPSERYFRNDFSPLTEIAAGHFLVMLAHEPECVDEQGKPLFSASEIDTLEKYYGKYDKDQHRVIVKIADFYDYGAWNPKDSQDRRSLWIWDWGRSEAPSEQQFRRIELQRGTTFYDWYRDRYFQGYRNDVATMKAHPEYVTQNMLRAALADIYTKSRVSKVSFVGLLANQLEIIAQRQ